MYPTAIKRPKMQQSLLHHENVTRKLDKKSKTHLFWTSKHISVWVYLQCSVSYLIKAAEKHDLASSFCAGFDLLQLPLASLADEMSTVVVGCIIVNRKPLTNTNSCSEAFIFLKSNCQKSWNFNLQQTEKAIPAKKCKKPRKKHKT